MMKTVSNISELNLNYETTIFVVTLQKLNINYL